MILGMLWGEHPGGKTNNSVATVHRKDGGSGTEENAGF